MVLETARHGSTLPVVLTGMLGRERETSRLRAIIRDPAVRMVTITGPGGVGKTRLAVAVASGITEDLDVVFVSLSTIRDPERIAPAIGRALGLNLEPGAEGEAMLFPALGERQTILVLDNLEQVSGATPVLSRLLDHIPGLTILATSQVALDVAGEHRFPLAPLTVPDSSARDALASDAVALFLERARAVDPALPVNEETLATIAAICRRLDGLPLAIELAAARVNLLSPASMLQRLDDRFGMLSSQREDLDNRHRTLRAAIAWTYDLLDPVEQALLRRLAVFAGGVPLDGAEAVRTSADDRSVAEVLESLVRRSILQPQTGKNGAKRYQMLESVREFGIDQLTRLGEEESARLAHAEWVNRLAGEAGPYLKSGDQVPWLAHLELESGNIRSAIDWSLGHGQHELVANIVAKIWSFFANRGMVTDAGRWLGSALSGETDVLPETRAEALVASGNLSLLYHRNMEEGERQMQQALHLAEAIGHTRAEMHAYIGLGIAAYDRGDYARAMDMYTRAEGMTRHTGDPGDVATVLGNLGVVAWQVGNHEDAFAYWEESVQINAKIGHVINEAPIQTNLGAGKLDLRRLDEADAHLTRALELQRRINNRVSLAITLLNCGEAALLRHRFPAARAHLHEARDIGRETGHKVFEAAANTRLAIVYSLEGEVRQAAMLILEAIDLHGDTREPMRVLELVEATAAVSKAAGMFAGAGEMLAAGGLIRRDYGDGGAGFGPDSREDVEAILRAELGDSAFDAAWQEGSSLDFDGMKRRARIIARQIVGRRFLTPEIARPSSAAPEASSTVADYGLTSREMDVLRLLGRGRSTQAIADELSVSPRTVATHIGNILAKMDVASRTAAVAIAIRDGVIPADG